MMGCSRISRGITASTKPSPHASSVDSAAKSYVAKLQGSKAGYGVVIGEPTPVKATGGVDASTEDFAAACSLWLEDSIAGQVAFNRCPGQRQIAAVRGQLHLRNMRLTPAQVIPLATALGVTHVVTSTVSRSGQSITLTYQNHTADGKPFGSPLAISGNEAQVLEKLPGLAGQLASSFGIGSPKLLDLTGTTPAEMVSIGVQLRDYAAPATPAQVKQFDPIAAHNPLGGLMLVYNSVPTADVTARLLTQAGDNTVVLDALSNMPRPPNGLQSAIAAGLSHNPSNYELLNIKLGMLTPNDYAGRRAVAEQCVSASPANALAWLSLGELISYQADSIRRARFASEISATQWAQLSELYPLWEACLAESTRLAPRDAFCWKELAKAATFNSHAKLADHALWTALKLDPDQIGAYTWGFEMYQPKWFDAPDKLFILIQKAQSRPTTRRILAPSILSLLEQADYLRDPQAQRIALSIFLWMLDAPDLTSNLPSSFVGDRVALHVARTTAAQWTSIGDLLSTRAADVQNGAYPSDLGAGEEDLLSRLDSLATFAYSKATRLAPKDSDAWARYAAAAFSGGDASGGTAAVLRAISLDPHNRRPYRVGFHYWQPNWVGNETSDLQPTIDKVEADPQLFRDLSPNILYAIDRNKLGASQMSKAEAEFEKLLQSNPSDPYVIASIGDRLYDTNRKPEAVDWLRKAAEARPNDPHRLFQYVTVLHNLSRYDEAVAEYRKILKLDPKFTDAKYWLSTILIYQGKSGDAVTLLRDVVAVRPKRAGAHYYLGEALEATGDHAGARSEWAKAADLDPKNNDHGGDAAGRLIQ